MTVEVVSGFTSGTAPRLTVRQVDSKLLMSALHYSNSFSLQIDNVETCTYDSEPCVLDMHLPHMSTQQYFQNTTMYYTQCEAGSTESYHYACPDERDYVVQCPGDTNNDTVIYSYCDFFEAPTCVDLATNSSENKLSNCTRISYSDVDVTCRCTVLDSSYADTDWTSLPSDIDLNWVRTGSLELEQEVEALTDMELPGRRLMNIQQDRHRRLSATSGGLKSRLVSMRNWEHTVIEHLNPEEYDDLTIYVLGGFISIFVMALLIVWILMFFTVLK